MSKTADSGIDEQQRQANEGRDQTRDWRGPHTNHKTGEVYYLGPHGPELVNIPKPSTPILPRLTKREYFAALCLQGILANESQVLCETKVEKAVKHADSLIQELNKTNQNG